MNYTRRFILDMVEIAALSESGGRHVTIVLPTTDPKRSFYLTYDVRSKKVDSVIEQIGRRKRVASVDDLLREPNPAI